MMYRMRGNYEELNITTSSWIYLLKFYRLGTKKINKYLTEKQTINKMTYIILEGIGDSERTELTERNFNDTAAHKHLILNFLPKGISL